MTADTDRQREDCDRVAAIIEKHTGARCGRAMIVAQGKRCMDSPADVAAEILDMLSVESEAEARDRTALDAIAEALRDGADDTEGYVTAADQVREIARFVAASGRATRKDESS